MPKRIEGGDFTSADRSGALSDYVSAVYGLIDKWDKSSLKEVDKPDLTIDIYSSEGFSEQITVPSEVANEGADAILDYLESEYDFDPDYEDMWIEAYFDADDVLTYQGE